MVEGRKQEREQESKKESKGDWIRFYDKTTHDNSLTPGEMTLIYSQGSYSHDLVTSY